MGLSVISSLAGSAAASAAPQINLTGAAGLPGDFAALLSGQLQSLIGTLPGAGGDAKLAAGLDPAGQETAPDGADEEAGPLDPALIAALMGNPQVQAPLPAQHGASLQSAVDGAGLTISGNGQGLPWSPTPAEAGAPGLGESADPLGLTGKAAPAGLAIAPDETAKIAAADASATAATAANLTASPNGASQAAHHPHAAEPTSIAPHLRDSAWPQQFGEKIVWLARNDQQSAQININPPQLGPVQITLNLSGDQASAVFASPHAEVRQAIENALPQLKEMLSTAGINLGQADVGANLARQNPDNAFQAPNAKHSGDENAILSASDKAVTTGISSVLQKGRGLVDLFA